MASTKSITVDILSDRQQNILRFICSFFNKNNYPPTIREIGENVGISSTSVVNYNLAKLEDLKLLFRRKEVSRGLTLNWEELRNSELVTALGLGDSVQAPVSTGRELETSNGFLQVPVLGTIAAGEPIAVEPRDRANADEWVDVAYSTFNLTGNPDDYFALRVKGDSMVDASVLNGDVVILRHQQTANNGEMVAAWIEGDEETTLKFLYKEGANVRLEPANPNFDPIIRRAEQVLINGKVVSVMRSLN